MLTAFYIWGRVLAAGGIASIGSYRPHASAAVYLQNGLHLLWLALYTPRWLHGGAAIPVLAACILAVRERVAATALLNAPRTLSGIVAFGMLVTLHATAGRLDFRQLTEEGRDIQREIDAMAQHRSLLKPQTRLLFLNSPFPERFEWGTTFIALLTSRESNLYVRRADRVQATSAQEARERFDVVLSWDGNAFQICDSSFFQDVPVGELARQPCRVVEK